MQPIDRKRYVIEFENKLFLVRSIHPNYESQFLNDWCKDKFISDFHVENFSSYKEIGHLVKQDYQKLILKSIDILGNTQKTYEIINSKIIVKIERFEICEVFSAQISFENIIESKNDGKTYTHKGISNI
jgi:hypothetical protein